MTGAELPRAADPAPSRSVIEPIHAPKASEVFAKVLRQKILDGDFAEGQLLPPERSLVEQSRLSRASVREAIGILKQQGLVVTRPGRNGGSIVTRPTSQELVSSLETYLLSQGWGRDNATVLEMREIMEPWCAAFAASRRTEADVARIQEAHERAVASISTIEKYVDAGQVWHTAVAEASHNVLLAAFMGARSDSVLSAADHARYDSLEARKSSLQVHQTITDAIEKRDPERAFEVMAGHVRGSASPLLQCLVASVAQPASVADG